MAALRGEAFSPRPTKRRPATPVPAAITLVKASIKMENHRWTIQKPSRCVPRSDPGPQSPPSTALG